MSASTKGKWKLRQWMSIIIELSIHGRCWPPKPYLILDYLFRDQSWGSHRRSFDHGSMGRWVTYFGNRWTVPWTSLKKNNWCLASSQYKTACILIGHSKHTSVYFNGWNWMLLYLERRVLFFYGVTPGKPLDGANYCDNAGQSIMMNLTPSPPSMLSFINKYRENLDVYL